MSEVLDAMKGAPHIHMVLLENARVRVLEYHVKPGDKAGMHRHPDGVIYHLSGRLRLRSTTLDGKSTEYDAEPGTVRWAPAYTHAIENVGNTEGRGLHIELK